MKQKKCLGCGVLLQNSAKELPGFVQKLDQDYCQSCFRLKHYRDFKRVKQDVDTNETNVFIENFKGHIFWVVDIMHLHQSLHQGLIRSLNQKNVVLLINKRDLLPNSVSDNKLKQGIQSILKDYHIRLQEVLFVSANKRQTLEPLLPYIMDAPCAFVGCVNAGKSSLLNTLLKDDTLSVSPVSSTTAGIIKLENEHFELYDTPGILSETPLVNKFTEKNLIQLAPSKTIKPNVHQIYQKQAIMLGNLGYIELEPQTKVNVVSYLPFSVKRVKPDRAEANLKIDHEFMIENPKYRQRTWRIDHHRIDIEIFDVGFISIQGELKTLKTVMDKEADIIIRKALI